MKAGRRGQDEAKTLRRGRLLPRTSYPKRKTFRSFIRSFFSDFLTHTTLHGLNYLVLPDFSKFERIFWGLMFLLSLVGIGFTSLETWTRYGGTVTYIGTTRHPLSEVPFPSVSICDGTMVDWQRALRLNESDLPAPLNGSREAALELLKRLGYAGFGDFDFLDQLRLRNVSLAALGSISVSQLLRKVKRPCEEVFSGFCWWKDKELDCCSIFELQVTDRGYCWAFNSDTSEQSKRFSLNPTPDGRWLDKNGELRPRRSVARGPWSGLTVEITLMSEESLPPDRNITSTSLKVIVSDPRAFPQGTYITVPDGVLGNLAVWGDSIHTRPEVRSLSMNIRDCVFEDEDFGQKLRNQYNQENCIYECYRKYTIKYCGCVPDFLFLDPVNGPSPKPCNVEGLLCLSAFNDELNHLQPVGRGEEGEREGIVCDCPKDCNSHQYVTELFSAFGTGNHSKIILDVFFRLSYCVLYETGITNDWLTTIVSFGGIAGLFLGASLLSIAELLYFLTIRLYCIWAGSRWINQKARRIKFNKKEDVLY